MKIVKKKTDLKLCSIILNDEGSCDTSSKYTYIFESNMFIKNFDEKDIYIDVEEPETLKEWLELKNISKKELVEWLNKNYNN